MIRTSSTPPRNVLRHSSGNCTFHTLGYVKSWNHRFVHPLHVIAVHRTYRRQANRCVVYVKGVLEGKYKSSVFPGMITAFVTLEDKKERGVGKQNFEYAPGFKEFMLILRSHSRHVYEFVAKHIPMMEDRSILYVVNLTVVYVVLIPYQRKFNKLRVPRFPVIIHQGNALQILRDCVLLTRFGETAVCSTRFHAIRSAPTKGLSVDGPPSQCLLCGSA